MRPFKAVISGGHLTPAIALIENLEKRGFSLFYFGRKFAMEGSQSASFERNYARKYRLQFIEIDSGKFPRYFTWYYFLSLFKIFSGFCRCFLYLLKIRPDIIVSFGGFLSFPLSLAGKILGIPVVIHEQTRVFGLSNRTIGKIADKICLSYNPTLKVPSHLKTTVTGIPLRRSIFTPVKYFVPGNKEKPLIYITGGSQGSQSINLFLLKVIPLFLKKYRIIHAVGQSQSESVFQKIKSFKNTLPLNIKEDYTIEKSVEPDKVGSILRQADLVISRSGANTVAELCFFRKKTILIPLPWSAESEQRENGLFLVKTGLAKILDQNKLTLSLLKEAIEEMMILPYEPKKSDVKLIFDPRAENLVSEIETYLIR